MISGKKHEWGKRIERAIDLAGQQSGSSEVLAFYSQILQFQKTVYEDVSSQPAAGSDGTLRGRLDVDTAARHLPALLLLVQGSGPSKLAQQAADIGGERLEQQRQMLHDFLTVTDADIVGPSSFFARAVFQPYAEHLATGPSSQLAGFAGSVCPVCNAQPQLAVLRPEGDGGKRFLVCSFCLTEWEFRRVLCPVCGEVDHQKLPRYSAEGLAVRVEACDTCKHYLKSVDMTVDGHAVPVVDEVATAPLDVWAMENGFTKISVNLMGF